MKTINMINEIKELEAKLSLAASLGREYFSDEATEMKLKLQELKFSSYFSQ